MRLLKTIFYSFFLPLFLVTFAGCHTELSKLEETQNQLFTLLTEQDLPQESKYTVISRYANNLLAEKKYNDLLIFLSSYVENNPDDMYNVYWLLMLAHTYLQLEAEPMAEYYFFHTSLSYYLLPIFWFEYESHLEHYNQCLHLRIL